MLFARNNQAAAPLLSCPACFNTSLVPGRCSGNWQSLCCKRARAVAVDDEWMLCIQPHSPQCKPFCSLTSQSIQLSHPTVLILLRNDLREKKKWKTPFEQSAVAGGLQLPGCVWMMQSCFLLSCLVNALYSHDPGPSRAKTCCKHDPCLPQFSGGMPTGKRQMDVFTVLPLPRAQK